MNLVCIGKQVLFAVAVEVYHVLYLVCLSQGHYVLFYFYSLGC